MKKTKYLVKWAIVVEAETHAEAAISAFIAQKKPTKPDTLFRIIDMETGEFHAINLENKKFDSII